MTAREFFDLVSRMRAAQKKFFNSRCKLDLKDSLRLEKQVDDEIARVDATLPKSDPQTKMFE